MVTADAETSIDFPSSFPSSDLGTAVCEFPASQPRGEAELRKTGVPKPELGNEEDRGASGFTDTIINDWLKAALDLP